MNGLLQICPRGGGGARLAIRQNQPKTSARAALMAHFSCGSIVLRSGLGFTAQPKSLLHGARRRAPERQTRWAIPLSCAADPCPDFRRFATPPPAQARAGQAFGPPCRLARAGTGRGTPASRNADPMIGSGDDRLGPNQSKPVDTLGIILNRPDESRRAWGAIECNRAESLEHDPETCEAVFGKDQAQTKNESGMTIRTKSSRFGCKQGRAPRSDRRAS